MKMNQFALERPQIQHKHVVKYGKDNELSQSIKRVTTNCLLICLGCADGWSHTCCVSLIFLPGLFFALFPFLFLLS